MKTAKQVRKEAYALQFAETYEHHFTIPEYLQPALSLYKRLNWNAAHFLKLWEYNVGTPRAGTIIRYGNLFHVQFSKDCSLDKIKHAILADPHIQLDMSFRAAPNKPAYVIIDFRQSDKTTLR